MEDISEAEKEGVGTTQSGSGVLQTQRFVMTAPDGSLFFAMELKTIQ